MSIQFQRIDTDEGSFVAAYDTVSDSFVSRAYKRPLDLVNYLCKKDLRMFHSFLDGEGRDSLKERATEALAGQCDYLLTRKSIESTAEAWSRASVGKNIPRKFLVQFKKFYDFLIAVIAPHQGYLSADFDTIKSWLEDFDLYYEIGDELERVDEAVRKVYEGKSIDKHESIVAALYMRLLISKIRAKCFKKATPVNVLGKLF